MTILKTKNKAMTLVELLLAVFILAVGIVSTLFFFSSTMLLTGLSRDITIATTHGEYILEEMHTQKKLTDIMNMDWAKWAQKEELSSLPQETIEVQFGDPSQRPLDVHVIVHWIKQGRPNEVDLYTKVYRDEEKSQ